MESHNSLRGTEHLLERDADKVLSRRNLEFNAISGESFSSHANAKTAAENVRVKAGGADLVEADR